MTLLGRPLNTSEVKIILNQLIDDCSHLFDDCENIIKIDCSSFNTINVKDMAFMFDSCINLISVKYFCYSKSYNSYLKFL